MHVLAHYALEMDGGATLGNNAECGERRGEGCLGVGAYFNGVNLSLIL